MVFTNRHLQERDHKDFEDMWILIGCSDRVEYHVGYDFITQKDELVIIDEADIFMFEDPCKF